MLGAGVVLTGDACVPPQLHGLFDDLLGHFFDASHLAASSGKHDAGSKHAHGDLRFDLLFYKLEVLAQAGVDDCVEHLAFNFLARKSGIIFESDFLARRGSSKFRRALVDFQLFGPGERNSQS